MRTILFGTTLNGMVTAQINTAPLFGFIMQHDAHVVSWRNWLAAVEWFKGRDWLLRMTLGCAPK